MATGILTNILVQVWFLINLIKIINIKVKHLPSKVATETNMARNLNLSTIAMASLTGKWVLIQKGMMVR